jgi:hypothetical protein
MWQELVEVVEKVTMPMTGKQGRGWTDKAPYLCDTPRVVSIRTRFLISVGSDDMV